MGYSYNTNCKFKKKQRVYITKDSGTYIVLFPVGNSKRGSLVTNAVTNAAVSARSADVLPLNQQAVSRLSSEATSDEIISKINELVDRLNNFNY